MALAGDDLPHAVVVRYGFGAADFGRRAGREGIGEPDGAAHGRINLNRGDFALFAGGRDQEGTLCAELSERGVLPRGRDGREDADGAGVALEQHLLYAGCKGEVAFEGEGTVGEVAFAGAALLAIGVERVGEAEVVGKVA